MKLRELERQAAREPENLALRLRLAAALRAAGRHEEAVALVRSVAVAYQAGGRLVQALAVCRSLLELAPDDLATRSLFAELEAARTGGPGEEPTQWDDGSGRRRLATAPLPLAPAASEPPAPLAAEADGDDEITGQPPSAAERTRPRVDDDGADDDDEESLDTAPTPLAEIIDGSPAGLAFGGLPVAAQRELAARRLPRRYEPGFVIVREGEPGDSCFVVAAGVVRVLRQDRDRPGAAAEVARLGPGELFGERALIADHRRQASVQAVDRVDALEIPRRVFVAVAAGHPAAAAGLERLYRERLLGSLVAHAPGFRGLSADRRAALLGRFAARRLEAGQTIVREGQHGAGLWVIVFGAVEVTRRAGGRGAVHLARLGAGDYLAELPRAPAAVAGASVAATSPTEVAELTRRDLDDLVAAFPRLLDDLRAAGHGDLAAAGLVAGRAALV
jgi:CRP-like cAMP-binding protein